VIKIDGTILCFFLAFVRGHYIERFPLVDRHKAMPNNHDYSHLELLVWVALISPPNIIQNGLNLGMLSLLFELELTLAKVLIHVNFGFVLSLLPKKQILYYSSLIRMSLKVVKFKVSIVSSFLETVFMNGYDCQCFPHFSSEYLETNNYNINFGLNN
jgi:hypothetical protein